MIGGDANKIAYQKAGQHSYSMSTCQFWFDRLENTLDSYLKKTLKTSRDMNVRQFHSISFFDLQYLRETFEGKVDIDPDVRQKTMNAGDCCTYIFRIWFFHFS